MKIEINDELLKETMLVLNELPSKASRHILNKWEHPDFVKVIEDKKIIPKKKKPSKRVKENALQQNSDSECIPGETGL